VTWEVRVDALGYHRTPGGIFDDLVPAELSDHYDFQAA
jgi:hypothetical protein